METLASNAVFQKLGLSSLDVKDLVICRACFAVFPYIDGDRMHRRCPACRSTSISPAAASRLSVDYNALWMWKVKATRTPATVP